MIKFFRKIRYDLMEKNNTGKYLKYAVGEIILVVIGILLALQINNFNEQKKQKVKEIELLSNLNRTIETDLKSIIYFKSELNESQKSISIILEHLINDLPYSDSLKFHFASISHVPQIKLNSSVFESLKSESLTLISNRALRQDLIMFYGDIVTTQQERNSEHRHLIYESFTNLLITRFDEFWKSNAFDLMEDPEFEDYTFQNEPLQGEMTPIDYEALKNDQEFLFYLKSLKNVNFWLLEFQNFSVETSIRELIKDISMELERLD